MAIEREIPIEEGLLLLDGAGEVSQAGAAKELDGLHSEARAGLYGQHAGALVEEALDSFGEIGVSQ